MGNVSHDQRFAQLQAVRESWCRDARDVVDRTDATIELDGRELVDIPSFFLALGRAVNGPDGYFGGCLDALSDCLNGGFGLVAPFTLQIHYADSARNSLGRDALLLWREAWAANVLSDSTMNERDLADLGLPLSELPADATPYFDSIISVLTDGGVNVVLDSAGS